jgi:predicted membrane-bound spermidine synthase
VARHYATNAAGNGDSPPRPPALTTRGPFDNPVAGRGARRRVRVVGSRQARLLAPLVFGSGWCALVYQTGWLRELRLVFGASTPATAAALAIFMAGLGLGGALLGRRADAHPNPLRLYGLLELGIAAGAALSPLLFAAVRAVYFATGGAAALGDAGALAARLALSALALGVPTFLMGGTLPAAAKGAEPAADRDRRATALLYGVNTLGALCGVLATTFFLLEHLGTRATVLSAAAVNVAIGAAAVLASRRPVPAGAAAETPAEPEPAADGGEPAPAAAPAGFVFAAAALVGFVFFLLEIVWYRMLAPLLGGSTYTFGLVLAVALAGIGVGGALAAVPARWSRPTLRLFAATCGLEALGAAAAFGLGDRVALLAMALRPAEGAGLAGFAGGWTLVSAIVVLPAALVAGFQFPLLIGLLGRGGGRVGRHVGSVYLWNTAGAIAGSLVGGFGLLPALGAPGCWRLAVLLLAALCAAAIALSLRRERRHPALAAAAGAAALAAALLFATGPTAAWRHSGIGVGLAGLALPADRNDTRAWITQQRYRVGWERDGVESAVAIWRADGIAFVVNGKVDGNAKFDAGTQIMAPLVGAALHPNPRTALVVGLGTGSSAGWLAAVPGVERVDVAELEPSVLEVARRCAPANRDVLANPRVHVHIGDARELLMTSRERYDLIFSEPSNPYRAGIASLYTQEFYRSVAGRLAPGGIFSQWVQAYGVDAGTVACIAATLRSVFADVEVWETTPGDLLFVCSAGPKDYAVPALAARVAAEPFRSALRVAWGLEGVEGLLAGFFATDAFARDALARAGRRQLNTDDRSPVEFGFIRSLADTAPWLPPFRAETRARGAHRPAVHGGDVDWARVDANRLLTHLWQNAELENPEESPVAAVYQEHREGRLPAMVRAWEDGSWKPVPAFERLLLAEALAETGDARALPLLTELAPLWPGTCAGLEAALYYRAGDPPRALAALERAAAGFRADPWGSWGVTERTIGIGALLAKEHRWAVRRVFDALAQPFSVNVLEQERVGALIRVGSMIDCRHAERGLAAFEPDVPWEGGLLRYRAACYEKTGDPAAGRARRDLVAFVAGREAGAEEPAEAQYGP